MFAVAQRTRQKVVRSGAMESPDVPPEGQFANDNSKVGPDEEVGDSGPPAAAIVDADAAVGHDKEEGGAADTPASGVLLTSTEPPEKPEGEPSVFSPKALRRLRLAAARHLAASGQPEAAAALVAAAGEGDSDDSDEEEEEADKKEEAEKVEEEEGGAEAGAQGLAERDTVPPASGEVSAPASPLRRKLTARAAPAVPSPSRVLRSSVSHASPSLQQPSPAAAAASAIESLPSTDHPARGDLSPEAIRCLRLAAARHLAATGQHAAAAAIAAAAGRAGKKKKKKKKLVPSPPPCLEGQEHECSTAESDGSHGGRSGRGAASVVGSLGPRDAAAEHGASPSRTEIGLDTVAAAAAPASAAHPSREGLGGSMAGVGTSSGAPSASEAGAGDDELGRQQQQRRRARRKERHRLREKEGGGGRGEADARPAAAAVPPPPPAGSTPPPLHLRVGPGPATQEGMPERPPSVAGGTRTRSVGARGGATSLASLHGSRGGAAEDSAPPPAAPAPVPQEPPAKVARQPAFVF